MNLGLHPRLRPMFEIAGLLEEVARELAKEARKRADARRPRVRRGATLRPGQETPLWNALVELGRPLLRKRGDRAILARELGVHRARVGEFFDTRSAMPDAERALRLLVHLGHLAAREEMSASAPGASAPAPGNVRNTNIGSGR
jgi:hypothetical protein